MIGENRYYRVLSGYVQFRHRLDEDFETLLLIPDREFCTIPWGQVLAYLFRNYIGMIMERTRCSESAEVRQLTNHQLLCDLIKYAAAWSHSHWRDSFPVISDHKRQAWQVLGRYVSNPLSFYPAKQPINTYFDFPWQIFKYHSNPESDDWEVIFEGRCGHATILYF